MPTLVDDAAGVGAPADPATTPPDRARLRRTMGLVALVVALAADHEVVFLEAPPSARRIVDASDVRLVEALRTIAADPQHLGARIGHSLRRCRHRQARDQQPLAGAVAVPDEAGLHQLSAALTRMDADG